MKTMIPEFANFCYSTEVGFDMLQLLHLPDLSHEWQHSVYSRDSKWTIDAEFPLPHHALRSRSQLSCQLSPHATASQFLTHDWSVHFHK